ncbi:MAG: hypothetical protein LJE97_09390 [Betaproteobacteria bacterium]|jgi:hypothetical protein|nr:hypothetical protein [Betaproteobacteria bacterium]
MNRKLLVGLFAIGLLVAGARLLAAEQEHEHMHSAGVPTPATDTRQLVRFPEPLREHELANMRDHLMTLQRIQDALGRGEFEKAADLAEQRLGMSSFKLHGAHEVAPYMPQGMRDTGTAMHRAASRFALAAQEAGATGDLKASIAALSRVTEQCVACHAAYRLN